MSTKSKVKLKPKVKDEGLPTQSEVLKNELNRKPGVKSKKKKAKPLTAKAKALKIAKAKANTKAKPGVKAKIKTVKAKVKPTTKAMSPAKAKALIDKQGKDKRRTKRSLVDIEAAQVSECEVGCGSVGEAKEELGSVSCERGGGASHTEGKESGSHNGTLDGLPPENANNADLPDPPDPPNTLTTPDDIDPPTNPPNAGALDVIHGISVMELALHDAGITPQYLAEKLVAELTADQVKLHYDTATGKFVTSDGYTDWGTRQRARIDAQKLLGLYPAEELAHSLTEKTISFLKLIDGEGREALPIDDDPDKIHNVGWEDVG